MNYLMLYMSIRINTYMKSRKAAKILIKRAKQNPDLYSATEVQYAKLFRKYESKTSDSDSRCREADGLHSEGKQPTESK
jgi:hypothetical protein